jgi:deoxyribonuclease IV
MRLGRHYSPGGGSVLQAILTAREEGAGAVQVFPGGNQARRVSAVHSPDAAMVRDLVDDMGLYVAVHAAYVINPTSADEAIREDSRRYLADCLRWAQELCFHSVVYHPAAVQDGLDDMHEQREMMRDVLGRADADGVELICELPASGPFARWSDAHAMVRSVNDVRAKLCLDTAHLWGSGYTVDQMLRMFGSNNLMRDVGLVHLNPPAPGTFGSGLDRHWSIVGAGWGEGQIGRLLRQLVIYDTPVITESRNIRHDFLAMSEWMERQREAQPA